MIKQFLHHIDIHKLCTINDRVLLTISGGVDSMVMLHLFQNASFQVAVAHCNFCLRGNESDEDEALVEREANRYGVPFHIKHFRTAEYAEQQGLSIQMAARELRYNWFRELADAHQYKYVATAHHFNDSMETVLLNLVRGTGLEGLTGIPVKQERIIRPMLFATRDMITKYAEEQGLAWREDSSNADNKYHRNFLRNEVIPLLKKLNPGLESTFGTTLQRLQKSWLIFKDAFDEFVAEAVRYDGFNLLIQKKKVVARENSAMFLWELLKDRGFNFDQCLDIVSDTHQVGKLYYAGVYRLTIDRDFLILDQHEAGEPLHVTIDRYVEEVRAGNVCLLFNIVPRGEFTMRKDATIAQFDAEKVAFPLVWRTWRLGDHFIPLGMQRHKKVSDFLVDEKVPLAVKSQVTVLTSRQGEIIWIAGRRIADPFKVTDETEKILVIQMMNDK